MDSVTQFAHALLVLCAGLVLLAFLRARHR